MHPNRRLQSGAGGLASRRPLSTTAPAPGLRRADPECQAGGLVEAHRRYPRTALPDGRSLRPLSKGPGAGQPHQPPRRQSRELWRRLQQAPAPARRGPEIGTKPSARVRGHQRLRNDRDRPRRGEGGGDSGGAVHAGCDECALSRTG